MTTPAIKLAEDYRAVGTPERLSWGSIELQVTNLDRSVQFWTDVMGLRARATRSSGAIELGTRLQTLIVLHPGARQPVLSGHTGMYHVAIGMPSQQEFSRYLARLIERRIQASPVDHTMSKAIYLSDPDGHGIEIAYETPERFQRFVDHPSGIAMIDADGRLRSGRDPLDLRFELSQAPRVGLDLPISDDAFIAHLHLHVQALEPAIRFYEQIGFIRNLNLPKIGMADLGAGGAYTHRIAVNVWQGPNAKKPPADAAQLVGYEVRASDARILAEAATALQGELHTSLMLTRDLNGASLALRLLEQPTMALESL